MRLVLEIKRYLFCHKWRKRNQHNFTIAVNKFPIDQVSVGKYTYGGIYVLTYNVSVQLKIGNFCSIGPNVFFLLGAEHRTDCISTYPFLVKIFGEEIEGESKGNIIIEDDVWIGYGSTIMSGLTIGQGAVIAAGSVVTKDVPAYAVVGGIPANIIKYRFKPELIHELLKVDFGRLDKNMINDHIDDLYQELNDIEQLKWMPKKI